MSDKNDGVCPFTGTEYDCKNCDGHKDDWLGKGSHNIHMGHSVSGPLMRNNKKDWRGMAKYMTRTDGSPITGEELHIEFLKMHRDGKDVIPCGKCDRWCYKNGCQGHATAEV